MARVYTEQFDEAEKITGTSKPKGLGNERVTLLFRLALEVIDLVAKHEISGRELCLLREQVELILRAKGMMG